MKTADNPQLSRSRLTTQQRHRRCLTSSVTSGNAATAKRFDDQGSQRTARAVLRLYREAGSWSKLAAELDVNRGLLWKVAHGQIRRSSKVRNALRRRTWQRLVPWLRTK